MPEARTPYRLRSARRSSPDAGRLLVGAGLVGPGLVVRGAAVRPARRARRAPVAQGIEHRPPEAGAQVRILPGALQSALVRWRFPIELDVLTHHACDTLPAGGPSTPMLEGPRHSDGPILLRRLNRERSLKLSLVLATSARQAARRWATKLDGVPSLGTAPSRRVSPGTFKEQ